ncbi:uncharacterized protein N7511_006259 [Penicillium nucicola]|uniref:uncharacterized protein n=1 Tax=Penicillium nucicola TaxID=1850975 RepID=UPI002545907D|nr:uncharacterized protein N7511_006259 [Penicillium nucicola]KAJ5757565.1 hypothetical protein N7511_006259 [Penicillium nucicola]
MQLGQKLGDPTPLGMAGFATTLLTLSLAMMEFRGVSVQNVFIGNFCFVGCIALLISAQWEIVRGNTFGYTVLSAFGLFYGGYGAILLPTLGIADSYGGQTPEYYNAMGFFVLIWTVLNTIFLIASFSINMVYFGTFIAIEVCFGLDATANFVRADGNIALSATIMKVGGAFGFIAGLLGFYIVAHNLCQDSLPVCLPMGDAASLSKARRSMTGSE